MIFIYLFTSVQDFVNERYLSKQVLDKNDPSNFEYVWGSRAKSEITYRSCLEFVAKVNVQLYHIFNDTFDIYFNIYFY